MQGLDILLCGAAYPVGVAVGFGFNFVASHIGLPSIEIHSQDIRGALLAATLVGSVGALIAAPGCSTPFVAAFGLGAGAMLENYSRGQHEI
jgi:hypothetical protein